MSTFRSLTSSLGSLTVSSLRRSRTPNLPFQITHFSTSPIALAGPISRIRREKAAAKRKRNIARGEVLKAERRSRSDPFVGRPTKFTQALLKPSVVLVSPGGASHSRVGPDNWPALTNFGMPSEDSILLSSAARVAEEKRLEAMREKVKSENWDRLSHSEKIFYDDSDRAYLPQLEKLVQEDEKKQVAMSRLLDLTNANSSAVVAANREKAKAYFRKHEADTGSTEVQAGLLTVKILSMTEHMRRHRHDFTTKRSLKMAVHERQKLLKYLRRKYPERYVEFIKEIGLDDAAVVNEI